MYGHDGLLTTNETDQGFIKQNNTSNDDCKILNLRGVKYVTIKILDIKKIDRIILQIAPEHWIMTPEAGAVIGIIFLVAGLAAIIVANR